MQKTINRTSKLFCDRVRDGMALAGLEAKAPALVRAWNKKYPSPHKLTRQTAYRWLKASSPEIDIPNLYRLSDLLEVNARWLALGAPISPVKPITPDADLKIVIDAYQDLSPELQQDLRDEANKLLRYSKLGSRANPYPA